MDTVVGHNAQKSALQKNKNVNVWLFCGKRGIGKASLARAFARHVASTDTLEAHPDVIMIEDQSSPIGIEKIHKMRNFLHMSAIRAERKIVILDGLDGLNASTANSMLKILEEPPENSLILLISHNLYGVHVVIRSRCVTLRFSELTQVETREVIRMNFPNINIEEKAISLYPGTPGMVTGDIEKEISLYDNFLSLIRKENKTSALVDNMLETDLPMHKVEYLGLKAMRDAIYGVVKLQKSNDYPLDGHDISLMTRKYFKAREVFSTSRRLHAHREATIFRIVEIISNLLRQES